MREKGEGGRWEWEAGRNRMSFSKSRVPQLAGGGRRNHIYMCVCVTYIYIYHFFPYK